MRACFITFLAFFAWTGFSQGLSLEELQKGFEERMAEAANTRHQEIAELRAKYATALERHVKVVQTSGNLQKVIAVQTEIKDAKANIAELPTLPKEAGEDLKEYRSKLVAAEGKVDLSYAETVIDLADKMENALMAKESELTKNGEISYARKAKSIREKLIESPELVAARKLAGSSRKTPPPSTPLGVWRSLFAENMKVVSEGKYPVGLLSDVLREHGAEAAGPAAKIGEAAHSLTLCAPSPNTVRFSTKGTITRIRGKASLLHRQGHATCRITVGGEPVYSKLLNRDNREDSFDLRVDASRLIELVVDDNTHSGNDWVVWRNVEVR